MNAAEIPRNEPPEARAGLTWQWRREDLASDYPASTWTLTYWFKKTGSTGANFSIAASADGDNFAVSVAAATTGAYTAGDYTWAAIVTAGSEAYEIDRGRLKLLAKYSAAANLDDRSHARKALEAIEAVLENRATVDQQEYSIGSRMLKRMPAKDLLEFRDYYRGQVAMEDMVERARNGQGGNRLVVKL
jgi:hypothetical protein